MDHSGVVSGKSFPRYPSMSASLFVTFEGAAQRVAVAESDFLLLRLEGFDCCNHLFFRLPLLSDLDDFLKDRVAPFVAWSGEFS